MAHLPTSTQYLVLALGVMVLAIILGHVIQALARRQATYSRSGIPMRAPAVHVKHPGIHSRTGRHAYPFHAPTARETDSMRQRLDSMR